MTEEEIPRAAMMNAAPKPSLEARLDWLEADASALQARVAELEGVLLEARDDLTEWIDVAHQHRKKYPHIMQDFENDMQIVRRIDAALEGEKDE